MKGCRYLIEVTQEPQTHTLFVEVLLQKNQLLEYSGGKVTYGNDNNGFEVWKNIILEVFIVPTH